MDINEVKVQHLRNLLEFAISRPKGDLFRKEALVECQQIVEYLRANDPSWRSASNIAQDDEG